MGWGLLSISLQLATNIGKLGHKPYNNQHTELKQNSPIRQFSFENKLFLIHLEET